VNGSQTKPGTGKRLECLEFDSILGNCARFVWRNGEYDTSAIDFSKHKSTEQALRESEQRFRALFDSAPMLIWLADVNHLRTDCNRSWLEFTGRTDEQELGEGWSESIHPDDVERHLLSKAAPCTHEYRLRRYDGQYRWILEHVFPRSAEDGILVGFVGYCFDITEQKEVEAAQGEFSGRLIQAQEQERLRIARELHDDINQRLAILASGLRQVEGVASFTSAQSSYVKQLRCMADELVADIQRLSHQLHSSKLQHLGLTAAVRDVCRQFSKLHGIEIDCTVPELPENVGMKSSLCLFRIVQESLNNVAKHSQSRYAKVELVAEPAVLRLRVSDDGVGFDPADSRYSRGLGLVSMRERARAVGGEFAIISRPFVGTRIECSVPIRV